MLSHLLLALGMTLVGVRASADSCEAKFKKLADAGVPMNLLNQMAAKIKDRTVVTKEHIALVDYSKPSKDKRLYIINLADGSVRRHRVSHGRGNEASNKKTIFTLPEEVESGAKLPDESGSKKVSLGLYRILPEPEHSPRVGKSLAVDGLDKVNRDARRRRVLIQRCNFISDQDSAKPVGRSFGSFCVDPKSLTKMIDDLKGSVIFAGLSEKAKQSNEPGPEVQELLRCKGTKRPQLDNTSV